MRLHVTSLYLVWIKYSNVKWISTTVKQSLQDQYYKKCFSEINESSKGQIYKNFNKLFCSKICHIKSEKCL